MKKINQCEKRKYQNECAANNWMLFDSENKNCPNYEEGMKQFNQFLKEEGLLNDNKNLF